MTLPYRILVMLALLAGAFGSGWLGHVKYRAGVDARAALAQSETNRETERLAARAMQRVSDDHAVKIRRAAAVASDTRVAAVGLRDAIGDTAGSATAADGACGARLRLTAELLGACTELAEEGARIADELGARVDGLQSAAAGGVLVME